MKIKDIYSILFFLFLFNLCYGQVKQGSFFVYGTLNNNITGILPNGAYSTKGNDLGVAYFIQDKLAISGSYIAEHLCTDSSPWWLPTGDNSSAESNSWEFRGVELAGLYYLGRSRGQFKPYLKGGIAIESIKYYRWQSVMDESGKQGLMPHSAMVGTRYSVVVASGLDFFVNRTLAVNIEVGPRAKLLKSYGHETVIAAGGIDIKVGAKYFMNTGIRNPYRR